MITNALHFRETISSASALLFFGQLPTSVPINGLFKKQIIDENLNGLEQTNTQLFEGIN